jgi:hypothetical protein|tara:strand:- start:210270 stop:210494 length:225 start_codon:yes stop_codon:yes gene_type:complete
MHILDQQNFFETRHKFIGRSDVMPNVSIERKSDGEKLTDKFDTSKESADEVYVLRYQDKDTGKEKTKDIKITPM